MSALIVLFCIMGAGAILGLGVIELRERSRPQRTVRLTFGRDVTANAVLGVLARIAGLHRGVVVTLDVRADQGGIRHYLTTDQASMETLRGGFGALLPGLRLEPINAEDLTTDFRFGRVVRLRGRLRVLQSGDHEQTSASLLAALQPLGQNERVLLRWIVRPGRAMQLQHADRDGTAVPGDDRTRLRQKNAGPVLSVRGFIAASSGHPARGGHLLGRISSVLRARSTAYGQLRMTPRGGAGLRTALDRRAFLIGDRFAADELAGLLGWPIEAPALPGLTLGTSPLLMPSGRIPATGRVIGEATWPGMTRKIAQPVRGALSHSIIAGPTGVGKSTLLTSLLEQDMAAGRGLVLIDGKGDTVAALLARVPEHRRDDVIVLDCASSGALPGIRLFGLTDNEPELAADVVLSVFADLFKDSWGVLSERYMRAGLVAVAHDDHGTLADVPFVFTDAAYRRKLMTKMADPLVRATLQSFEAMSTGERAQQLGSTLNKLSSLLGRPVVRTVLGQAAPALDFHEVLRKKQIVVVSLAPARVGAAASRLIGAVVVFGLFQAVQARAGMTERARTPFMVCIDEPKALGDLPMPLDALLEQARGLGVGVTVAPQSLVQLPKSLRQAILTNAGTRIAFTQNADDARLLAKDLSGVAPEDLQDLAAFEAVARIGLGPGDVAPPVTIRTAAPNKPTSNADEIRKRSEARYGQTLRQVDAAINERHNATAQATAGTPGRTPRRPS